MSLVQAKRDIVESVRQLQESLCGECELEVAVVDCEDCHENYCKQCCEAVHKKGRRKRHSKFTKIQVCGQCEVVAAKKECFDCQEFYCLECCEIVHSKGQRVKHKQLRKIDTSGFRAVNYDNVNSMGLIVKQFSFSRFLCTPHEHTSEYTKQLSSCFQLCKSIAEMCREEEKPYVDTEPVTLELPQVPVPQQISLQIQSDDVLKQVEAELQLAEQIRVEKHNSISNVLSMVYSWRRPRQVTDFPSLFSAGNDFLSNRPPGMIPPFSSIDYLPMFKKGIFNDHFFLLALAAITTRRCLLSNMIASCEFADTGMYTFQFYRDEDMGMVGWQPVTIDHLIPCGKSREPVFGATDDPSELWGILIEKAYAKFLGAYSHLHYGDSASALYHLTGGTPVVECWNAGTLGKDCTERIWWRLNQGIEMGMILLCMKRNSEIPLLSNVFTSLERDRIPQFDDDTLNTINPECKLNWNSGEVVLLTSDVILERDRKRHRLIKLRDVHGDISWTGPWSDSSTTWTKEMREYTNHKQVNEHLVWMCLEDFVREYDTLCVLKSFSLLKDSMHPREEPWESYFGNLTPKEHYGMLVCDADQYSIIVHDGSAQKDNEDVESNDVSLSGNLLYDPPQWKNESDDVGYGSDTDGSPALLMSEKGVFSLNIKFSQPESPCPRGGSESSPLGYELLLFRGQEKALQKPLFPESADGEEDVGIEDYRIGKFGSHRNWEFPVHNRVAYLEGKNLVTQFSKSYEVPLQPGHYILVVQKQHPEDDLHYCLGIQPNDDHIKPTSCRVVVDQLGTLMEPHENIIAKDTTLSPRLVIQSAKQQRALA